MSLLVFARLLAISVFVCSSAYFFYGVCLLTGGRKPGSTGWTWFFLFSVVLVVVLTVIPLEALWALTHVGLFLLTAFVIALIIRIVLNIRVRVRARADRDRSRARNELRAGSKPIVDPLEESPSPEIEDRAVDLERQGFRRLRFGRKGEGRKLVLLRASDSVVAEVLAVPGPQPGRLQAREAAREPCCPSRASSDSEGGERVSLPSGRVSSSRARLELLGFGAVYLGYIALMLLLFALRFRAPYHPWEEAFTPGAVVHDYVPNAIGTAALIAVVAALHWWRETGLTSEPRASVWGVPILAFAGVVLLFVPQASQPHVAPVFTTLWFGIIVSAFNEELVCRGILLHGFARRWNEARAAWLTSILFGVAHFSSLLTGWSFAYVWGQAVDATLEGAILAKMRFATNSLWYPILLHALRNFAIYLTAFGPTPGTGAYRVTRPIFTVLGLVLFASFIVEDARLAWRHHRADTPAII
jgi:membrane protease YdiL (CAAX protease family)